MEAQFTEPKFWDAEAMQSEWLRVADICHGCRRCFNLCPSFSILFNGIDALDGEVEKLGAAVTRDVVDACYYCKLCYNHCPYTPPHEFRLDFPLLMVREKAVRAKIERPRLRDRLLVNTDLIGRSARWVAPLLNRLLRAGWFRALLQRVGGIHKDRRFPPIASETFPAWFRKQNVRRDGERKVALFAGCLTNYHYPSIGRATVQVLAKNGVAMAWPEQRCCGMPYFDTGDIAAATAHARSNVASLKAMVEQGYAVVSPIPTCSLMLKKEYPALLNTDDARLVAKNTYDVCEYLVGLHKKGQLSTDFPGRVGTVVYQAACHLRDQNIGYRARDLLQLIPGTTVEVIERCSGHDGSWSMKTEFFGASMQVGQKAFRAVNAAEAQLLTSDCPLSGLQLEQATGKTSCHPIELLNRAYGLPETKA
jgi:Fe-S oxidoreductase